MSKVPDRFLGYAFCVGDVLLELDQEYNITNADGAVKQSLGAAVSAQGKTNFLDLLTEKGRGLIKSSTGMLNGANRLGPFTVSVGPKARIWRLNSVYR